MKKFIAFIVLFFIWHLISIILNTKTFPSPFLVVLDLIKNFKSEIFFHLIISFYRIISGIFLGLIFGIFLGVVIGYFSFLNNYLSPFIYFLNLIPKIALMPIFIIIFGVGDLSKIIIIFSIVFFQMLISIRDGVSSIGKDYLYYINSIKKNFFFVFYNLIFPFIFPRIMTSLRISITTSMAVLFITETYATRYGIGFYIMDSLSRIDYISVFSGVFAMTIMGFLFFSFIDFLEKKYCSWSKINI